MDDSSGGGNAFEDRLLTSALPERVLLVAACCLFAFAFLSPDEENGLIATDAVWTATDQPHNLHATLKAVGSVTGAAASGGRGTGGGGECTYAEDISVRQCQTRVSVRVNLLTSRSDLLSHISRGR